MITKEQISKRTIDAVNALVNQGVARSVNEICKKLNYPRSNYGSIEGGERNAPILLVFRLVEEYGVNPHWLTKGDLPILNSIEGLPSTVVSGFWDRMSQLTTEFQINPDWLIFNQGPIQLTDTKEIQLKIKKVDLLNKLENIDSELSKNTKDSN